MNPLIILAIAVSVDTLIMLGINLYMMVQARKKPAELDKEYMVLHQRFDALSQIVSAQLAQNREESSKTGASLSQLIAEQLERTRQVSSQATLTVNQQVQSF